MRSIYTVTTLLQAEGSSYFSFLLSCFFFYLSMKSSPVFAQRSSSWFLGFHSPSPFSSTLRQAVEDSRCSLTIISFLSRLRCPGSFFCLAEAFVAMPLKTPPFHSNFRPGTALEYRLLIRCRSRKSFFFSRYLIVMLSPSAVFNSPSPRIFLLYFFRGCRTPFPSGFRVPPLPTNNVLFSNIPSLPPFLLFSLSRFSPLLWRVALFHLGFYLYGIFFFFLMTFFESSFLREESL